MLISSTTFPYQKEMVCQWNFLSFVIDLISIIVDFQYSVPKYYMILAGYFQNVIIYTNKYNIFIIEERTSNFYNQQAYYI